MIENKDSFVKGVFCLDCHRPMRRLRPKAVAVHERVQPTLHVLWKCDGCNEITCIEEDLI